MQFNRCLGCMEEIQGYSCPRCGFDPRKVPASNYVLPYGTVLNGHYVVGRVLGQGGFGITYIGYDLSLQRKVAIKEFYPKGQAMRMSTMSAQLQWGDDAASQDFRTTGMDSFLREARKMAKVEDIPEVVGVRESFQENDTAYIIMDYVEGKTLLSVLKEKGPMPWEEARDIFLPAISAMEKVHRAGLVHRDLSPDNLMLTGNGVRILDLGAAKDLSSGSGASSAQVAKGGFSPLEQYTQRGGSGPWSDVYAMAATIYYTLTGILPPSSTDRAEKDTIKWGELSRRHVPAAVIAALQNAMNITAKGRTQSMAELLSQLQSRKPIRVQQSSGRKPTAAIAAAAAAVVVLGTLLGFAVNGKKEPDAPALQAATIPQETTVPETTLPPETQPSRAHIMAAPENLSDINSNDRAKQPFWGQTAYKRGDVKTITFRGSMENAPADAQDVSDAGDRSVLAWMEGGDLFVASEGKIFPNENAAWMFGHFENVTSIDFGDCFDTSNVISMSYMFCCCTSLSTLDLSSFDTANAGNMQGMFYECSSLSELDVSCFNTSAVMDMNSMFGRCFNLTQLNLSSFDTARVTDMNFMFALCRSLTQLDLSSFDTSRVTDMSYMFYCCENLPQLDVSSFNTARVTDMSYMFYSCEGLPQLDLTSFDTARVADMNCMFFSCDSLTQLDLSSFDTARVTDMSYMFTHCQHLTRLDLSSFDTARVTDMHVMFSYCQSLTSLDLSGFQADNVTNFSDIFSSCKRLTDLKCSDPLILAEYQKR